MKIVLLGPKHCGKTSVGIALAERIGVRFVDVDRLIEQDTGKSPRSLYREGVSIFREAEVRAMKRALTEDDAVIAAGGGVVDNAEAAALLKPSADMRLVCLETAPATAWERVNAAGELPPFLNTADPQETHRLLHERRTAAYRLLTRETVNTEGRTIEEIVDRLVGNNQSAS